MALANDSRSETIYDLANMVRNLAAEHSMKVWTIQEQVFGPEPVDTEGKSGPVVESVDFVLREALATLTRTSAQLSRITERVGGEKPTGAEAPVSRSYGTSSSVGASPFR